MPYSITTKDGITIQNIPDDIDSNADELKARVAEIRAGGTDGISSSVGDSVAAVQDDRQQPGVTGGVGEQAAPEGQVSFPGSGVIEPAAALISGALAEPLAGIAGIAKGLLPGDAGDAAQAVESTREALTFQPRTKAGQEGLQTAGEFVEPATAFLQNVETFLGDETFETTKSPALAAAATAIPTAILEALGIGLAKGSLRVGARTKAASQANEVKQRIVEAAPDIERLKETSRAVYKELDESGVTVSKEGYRKLTDKIRVATSRAGFDKDITPKAASALNRIDAELGSAKTLTEIDTLRKVAQNAASTIDPADARMGSIIIDQIDSFLDEIPTGSLKGVKAADVGPKYKVARELWGRARRSELINESFEKAKNQASGFENGLVVQFRGILNNRKKSRFFKPKELDAMRKVVRGTTPENIAKLVGRLGFSEGHATNILGGSVGVAAGAAIAGPIGAVTVPVIGQVSRKLAQRLTRGNAEFADTIIRAGANAEEITKAYLKNTPKGKRSSLELSELLLRPDIALDVSKNSRNVLLREASEIAKGMRALRAAAATTAAGAPGAAKEIQSEATQ